MTSNNNNNHNHNSNSGDELYATAPVQSLNQQEYTLIEMPFRVNNTNRAIEMLNGVSHIEKVVNNEQKFLEVRFRGPMSHPAHGDKQSTNHLLLKVRRKRSNKKDIKVEIMGKIVNCIGFQGMVDFQYLQGEVFDASKTSLQETNQPLSSSSSSSSSSSYASLSSNTSIGSSMNGQSSAMNSLKNSQSIHSRLTSKNDNSTTATVASSASSSQSAQPSASSSSSVNASQDASSSQTKVQQQQAQSSQKQHDSSTLDLQSQLYSINQEEEEEQRRKKASAYLYEEDRTPTESSEQQKSNKRSSNMPVMGSSTAPTPSTQFQQLTIEEQNARMNQDKMNKQEKLNLTPPIFSRFDLPMDYEFRANPLSTMVTVTRDDGTTIFKRQLKQSGAKRPQVCQLSFSEDVPTGPDPNLGPAPFQEDDERESLMSAVRQLFEKRPIWSRRALQAQFESKKMKLHIKFVLPHIAYYYKDGPWRKLWVKYGVDPKNDKSMGIYQMLDFRVPAEFRTQVLQRRKQKGLMSENEEFGGVDLLRRAPKRKQAVHEDLRSIMFSAASQQSQSTKPSTTLDQSEMQDESHVHDDEDEEGNNKSVLTNQESYLFTSIPGQKSTVYQLCDIRLRSVLDIIRVQDPRKQIEVDDAELNEEKAKMKRKHNERYKFGTRMIKLRNAVCHEKYGWYTLDALEQIRFLMKKKIEQWIEKGNEYDDQDIVGVDSDDEDEDGGIGADDFDFEPEVGSTSNYRSTPASRRQTRPTQQATEMDDPMSDEDEDDDEEYEETLNAPSDLLLENNSTRRRP